MDSNFEKWIRGVFGDRTYPIYPNVYQNSDSFRNKRYELFKKLDPLTVGDFEWSSSTSILGEMGQASSHVLLPFEDSSLIRRELNLRDPNTDELELFRELVRKIIAVSEWQSFSVKDKSSSGFPHFIKGVGYKLSEVNRVFPRLEEIFRLSYNHEINKIAAIMGCYPLFTLGVRYQIDNINHSKGVSVNAKKRMAYSPEYIKTMGKKGEQVNIDFSVYSEQGFKDSRFVAARVRSMYALSYSYNCVIQALNNFLMDGLKKICSETLFSTPGEALTLLNSKGVSYKIALDYSNYGETMPGALVDILCEELEKKIRGLGEFLRMTYNAPKLIRGWRKNINEPFLNLDEIDYFTEIRSSLASGHGLVAFLGKLFSVFDSILVFRKLIPNFDINLHLANQYAGYTRLSSSDDEIICFTDKELEARYIKQIASLSIFKAEIQETPTYLGSIYLEDRTTRDIKRLLEHLTNYERSLHSKMFFELGVGCSIKEYVTNSYFELVFPVLSEFFLNELNIDLLEYIRKADEIATPTAIFLSNPDSIFYKLDPKLVNSAIFRNFFANIGKDNVAYHFRRLECA